MRKLILALVLTSSVAVCAQTEAETETKNAFKHLSAGVGVGTTGISVELGTTLCPFVTMRAGVDIMPKFSITNSIDIDRPAALNNVPTSMLEERYVNIPEYGAKVDVVGKPNMTQGKLLFDIYTGKNSMFHFTVGAYFGSQYAAKAKVLDKTIAAVELYNQDIKEGIIMPEPGYEDGIKIDLEGYALTPDKGRAELDLKTMTVKPYLGFGVGRTVPRKRVGCKLDVGVQFWGKPKVYDVYGDHVITKDEPGISSDFSDVIKIIDKVCVYPTLRFTIFGRIF